MKDFSKLTKFGIIVFVLVSGLAGYAVSHPVGHPLDGFHLVFFALGLYFLSAGSFAINQAQEWRIDAKMARTSGRPIPQGVYSPLQAYLMGGVLCLLGIFFLVLVSPLSAAVGAGTVFLYNVTYTLYWKKKSPFGAVPGAIPGALPVVIGYAANSPEIFSSECLYLFLIVFLWQMPHFWCLALRYQEDYSRGGIPVLPLKIGVEGTLYHIGLYVFAYIGLALASPWFLDAHYFYLFLVVPIGAKVLHEFFKYLKSESFVAGTSWLKFFLWTNLSMLVFITAPVFDKWIMYYL